MDAGEHLRGHIQEAFEMWQGRHRAAAAWRKRRERALIALTLLGVVLVLGWLLIRPAEETLVTVPVAAGVLSGVLGIIIGMLAIHLGVGKSPDLTIGAVSLKKLFRDADRRTDWPVFSRALNAFTATEDVKAICGVTLDTATGTDVIFIGQTTKTGPLLRYRTDGTTVETLGPVA